MRIPSIAAFILLIGPTTALAGEDPGAPPFTTERIQLIASEEADGWNYEFYRNHAYTCGVSGYQTFLLAYREDTPLSERRPLWMRLHGGGGGTWLRDGTYSPPVHYPRMLNEESFKLLKRHFGDPGLLEYVRGHSAGFRFLVASLCDHDFYSGVGQIDPYNPHNPDENGKKCRLDGLPANLSALAFARGRLNSGHVFVHGTSAGSIGTMTLTIALGRQGQTLSGAISDSWVMNGYLLPLMDSGCRDQRNVSTPTDHTLFLDRIGFYARAENLPEVAVSRGLVKTPLFLMWSRGDPGMCGEKMMTLQNSTGEELTGEGSWLMNQALTKAIDRHNPGGASRWRRVCVDNPDLPDSKCDRHSPSRFDVATFGGDNSRDGEDYNRVMLDWVTARLDDPLP